MMILKMTHDDDVISWVFCMMFCMMMMMMMMQRMMMMMMMMMIMMIMMLIVGCFLYGVSTDQQKGDRMLPLSQYRLTIFKSSSSSSWSWSSSYDHHQIIIINIISNAAEGWISFAAFCLLHLHWLSVTTCHHHYLHSRNGSFWWRWWASPSWWSWSSPAPWSWSSPARW